MKEMSAFLLVFVVNVQLDHACKVIGRVPGMPCKFSQCFRNFPWDHGRNSQQRTYLLLLSSVLWLIYFPVSLLQMSSRKKNVNSKLMRSSRLVSQHLWGKHSDLWVPLTHTSITTAVPQYVHWAAEAPMAPESAEESRLDDHVAPYGSLLVSAEGKLTWFIPWAPY